jgi:vacuolar-type H+-ATPase subunit E/Vma4
MKSWGSVASVVDALAEDVDAELARIRQGAEAEIEALRRADADDPVRISDRDARLAAAHREAAEALAREDWEDRRAALEDREAWIARAAALGLDRLRRPEGIDAAALARLIGEAADHLPGDRFEVLLSAACASRADESAWPAVAPSGGAELVRVRGSGEMPASGCVVRTPDGGAAFDNTFESRARRLEPAWRRRLVEIYSP